MAVPACSGRVLRLPFALQIAKDNGTVASLGPKPSGGVRRGVDIIVMSRFFTNCENFNSSFHSLYCEKLFCEK